MQTRLPATLAAHAPRAVMPPPSPRIVMNSRRFIVTPFSQREFPIMVAGLSAVFCIKQIGPHFQASRRVRVRSVHPVTTDMRRVHRLVRFVPVSDSCTDSIRSLCLRDKLAKVASVPCTIWCPVLLNGDDIRLPRADRRRTPLGPYLGAGVRLKSCASATIRRNAGAALPLFFATLGKTQNGRVI
jgi:hypothetical protein